MEDWVWSLICTAIILVSAGVVMQLGLSFLRFLLKKKLDLQLFYPTIKNLWRLVVTICAIYAFLKMVAHMSAATLLSAIGVSGLTIGIALQGFIRDVLTGFINLGARNFELGDEITVKNLVTGTVDKIGLHYVRLQGVDGRVHIVANSELTVVSVKKKD